MQERNGLRMLLFSKTCFEHTVFKKLSKRAHKSRVFLARCPLHYVTKNTASAEGASRRKFRDFSKNLLKNDPKRAQILVSCSKYGVCFRGSFPSQAKNYGAEVKRPSAHHPSPPSPQIWRGGRKHCLHSTLNVGARKSSNNCEFCVIELVLQEVIRLVLTIVFELTLYTNQRLTVY